MGSNSKYFLTTREMDQQEFHEWYTQQKHVIENWKSEPTDKSIFEGDKEYNRLLKEHLKAKKTFNDYKFDKRHNR